MTVAGIDMGSQSTKVVILEGNRILAAVTLQTGESGESEARQAMEEALRLANLKLEDVGSVVSTGTGRSRAPYAQQQRSTVTCLASGARFLFPQARTVVDAGAESSAAIRLSTDGTVADMVGNDKCAGGSGTFLDNMSKMLRILLVEMGKGITRIWKMTVAPRRRVTNMARKNMSHWILEKRLSRPSPSAVWVFILFPSGESNPKPNPPLPAGPIS